jgi:hypothetical protein
VPFAYSLLIVSLVLALGAVGFLREAEGYVSKHYGIENQALYGRNSQIAAWFFWSAVTSWSMSMALATRLAIAEKQRLQYLAAALPICGVLALGAALFIFPASYV